MAEGSAIRACRRMRPFSVVALPARAPAARPLAGPAGPHLRYRGVCVAIRAIGDIDIIAVHGPWAARLAAPPLRLRPMRSVDDSQSLPEKRQDTSAHRGHQQQKADRIREEPGSQQDKARDEDQGTVGKCLAGV